MSARLVVSAGPDEGKEFPLPERATLTIGRGDTAQLRLTDPTTSRAHCLIECMGGRTVVRDNGSKAGTKVNGKHLGTGEHELRADDIINIGSTRLRFQYVAQAPRAAEASPDDLSVAHEEVRKLSGSKLAHYEIGSVVGDGSSGVVFRAVDFKENREVALKVYTKDFAENEEALQRFIRAVKTMLPMRHSNLVTLYGGGKTGPFCWMAMEYVEGENLKETIDRIGRGGKIDWRPALRMAIDIARGLQYLHSEKIIHRNLSPGNILFSKLGTCKLGSLILAKALSGALAKDVTVGGNLPGEVRYLAPEQLGAGGPIDGRADVYSLGTLIYALLTGKTPFEAKTPLETATMILQREPMPPCKLNPSVPPALEKIVLKMLAKHPDDRFQMAMHAMMELEQLPKF